MKIRFSPFLADLTFDIISGTEEKEILLLPSDETLTLFIGILLLCKEFSNSPRNFRPIIIPWLHNSVESHLPWR